MAEGLCRAGAEVAILGTSEKVRESADALARTTGVVVHGIEGDLVREEEVTNIYKRLVESLDGQADILVNCAGVQHRCVAEDFPMEEWNRILRVNLGAMFQMSQLAARELSGVSISSPRTMLPFSSRPNSNLVSAIMMPFSSAYSAHFL